VLERFTTPGPDHDLNQRNVGVSVPRGPVRVSHDHPRNHDGAWFTVLVTRTTSHPRPGSDDITRAYEEGWVGTNGYVRPDGTRQRSALAFQGDVRTLDGRKVTEVFLVDLPDDLTHPGDGPPAGTETRLPRPPRGVVQRRLTFTTERKYPGVQGPRHWLRSSPDGTQIAFLMKDDAGVAQLWTVSPNGGPPRQVTHNPRPVASTITWSPDGRSIAHVMDGSVCVTEAGTGRTRRLTPRRTDATAPRPEACVFSPDGTQIAYVRRLPDSGGGASNQIFVVAVE
jgi:WD40 repeat protein